MNRCDGIESVRETEAEVRVTTSLSNKSVVK